MRRLSKSDIPTYLVSYRVRKKKQANLSCLHTYLYPCKICIISIQSFKLQISQNNFHHIWSCKQGNTSSQDEHQTILIPISCFFIGGLAR